MLAGLPTPSQLWSRAPRVRWWQRAVQFAPTRLALGLCILAPASALEVFAPRWGASLPRAVVAVALTVAYALGLLAYDRTIERRPAEELGPRGSAVEWGAGFALGVLLLGTTVGALCAMGAYHVEVGGSPRALLDGLCTFVPHALFEEIVFRVLVFKIAEESLGTWAALAIEGALFGAAHLGNPHATWGGALAIAVEAGALLTAAFAVTRRLWLVWGIHVGWNLAQGSLFGIRVSGTPLGPAWLSSSPLGSEKLSGGAFGVEASPVAVVVCVVVALLLLRAAHRKGQLVGWSEVRHRHQRFRDARDAARSSTAARK